MTPVRVLVVEDETLIAEAHRAYTERVEGFEVVGLAHTARAAMAALRAGPVDLVLLDLNLPDMHGLEIVRALRTAGSGTDVLAVSSARDVATVRQAVALGVTHYLLKPFTFATFKAKLESYAKYRAQLVGTGELAAQHEIDRAFATLRGPAHDTLPKGLDAHTLDLVLGALRGHSGGLSSAGGASGGLSGAGGSAGGLSGAGGASGPSGLSAAEVGLRTGTSRVTARRYLEHLADAGWVARHFRYGGPGRPEVEYRPA